MYKRTKRAFLILFLHSLSPSHKIDSICLKQVSGEVLTRESARNFIASALLMRWHNGFPFVRLLVKRGRFVRKNG
jgi:hypothetical protein